MEIPLSTARWVAPLSFIFDFAAQIYGLLSTPNMKDINDANLSFFTPAAAMVGIFFFSLQAAQVAWLYQLFKVDPKRNDGAAQAVISYVPYCIIGNMTIGIWMFFWNASALKLANLLVSINTVAQLLYVTTQTERLNLNSRASFFTHLFSKMFAGISVLDVLHNTSIAYFTDEKAGMFVQVFTALIFGLAAIGSDWILGSCLVYDLIALAAGQTGLGNTNWGKLLWIYAAVTAVIVVLKNTFKPSYEKKDTTYSDLPTQESQ